MSAVQVPPPPPPTPRRSRDGAPQQPHLPGFPSPPPPRRRAEGDDRLWLSYSRISAYRRCPLQFRFAYVDKLPSLPGPALSFGSAIHKALEVWWGAKLPHAPPVEVLLQALYDGWETQGFTGMPREEQVRWYHFGQDVLRRHHRRHAPQYVPAVAAEEWFELDLGDGLVLSGIIDHVARTPDGGLGVVDWKTDRTLRDRGAVARDLQLACYALAARELWGVEPEWVALDFVVPGIRVTVPRERIDTDGSAPCRPPRGRAGRSRPFRPHPWQRLPVLRLPRDLPGLRGRRPGCPGPRRDRAGRGPPPHPPRHPPRRGAGASGDPSPRDRPPRAPQRDP